MLSISLALVASMLATLAPSAYAEGWQVAGLVNIGEPTLRIVYDTSIYGSRARALQLVHSFQNEFWYLEQPGSTAGLMQVGYSDHMLGVQIQLYSDSSYIGMQVFNLFEWYGINMTGCWENPKVCPTWQAPVGR